MIVFVGICDRYVVIQWLPLSILKKLLLCRLQKESMMLFTLCDIINDALFYTVCHAKISSVNGELAMDISALNADPYRIFHRFITFGWNKYMTISIL